MADENVPAQAPTRSDDQILPFATWVPIGKSNFVLDLQKKQKNLIFQISVDILQNTNFFRAFIALSSVPAIYIQHFWNTLTYDEKTRAYSFQLDETRFTLDDNLLTEALEITPIDQAHQFMSPSPGDAIMDFVNQLGYTEAQIPSSSYALGREGRKEKDYECQAAQVKACCRKGKQTAHAPKSMASKERPSKASADKPSKPKPAKEKSTKTTLPQLTSKGKVVKVHKAKSKFQLVDKPDEEPAHSKPEPKLVHQGKGDKDDMELAIRTSSGSDTEVLLITKKLGEDVGKHENIKEKTVELDQGEARPDPGRTPESRHPPEQEVIDEDQARTDPGESLGALAGPDPEPTHDEFMADLHPKVHESLKFLADEHVFVKDPISSTGTLFSMKNLEDAFAIGDQFINDKSTKDEPEKPMWKDLSEEYMKERLHQRTFKSGSYKSVPKHFALYEALEASMEQVIPTSHIPDVVNNWAKSLASTYQAPAENSLLAKTKDMRTFMHSYCQKIGKNELTQADFEGQAYEANPEGDQVMIDVSKPLPLSSPPGHVTIQTQFFFNHDLYYLRYGSKGTGQALSISKTKAARYLYFGLNYSYLSIYGSMSIKAFSHYGYDYLKEITLHRDDYQEYKIAKKDIKSLYPSDFEDLNLLLLQGYLNHLSGSDKCMLSTAVKL
nr:hypothetical protein [Tanacetum cinerariifolium]